MVSVFVLAPWRGSRTDAYQVSVHSGNGSTSTEVRTDPTSKRHITATSDNGNVTIRYGPG